MTAYGVRCVPPILLLARINDDEWNYGSCTQVARVNGARGEGRMGVWRQKCGKTLVAPLPCDDQDHHQPCVLHVQPWRRDTCKRLWRNASSGVTHVVVSPRAQKQQRRRRRRRRQLQQQTNKAGKKKKSLT